MVAVTPFALEPAPPDEDQRVILRGVSWMLYEILLAARGDSAVPRMTYLNGALELMRPSISHEEIKKRIARMVEA
ncbi:MAG: hypothetical protein AB2A00_34120 [Myxococcota bacterium]